MKKEFYFKPQETYTQDEMKVIISDHLKYVSKGYEGYKTPEEYNAVIDELKPFKAEKRNTHLSKLLEKEVKEGLTKDAIALAGITDEDDDKAILAKIQETVKTREWLQPTVTNDDGAVKKLTETHKKNLVTETNDVDIKFANV